MWRFEAKEALLPPREEMHPDPLFLKWHHENVFRGV
jgi:hypothetical protein